MMAAVRSKENKAEVALRRALWRLGFRYRLHSRSVLGRPDIVLTRYRTAIFVDGDYWHGRALREGGEAQLRQVIRGPRFDWWRDKLARNIARDNKVTASLEGEGWTVIRVWESEVVQDLDGVVSRIASTLRGISSR
jgi:DNA mismatch endonuclease, patch repair protein